MTRKDYILFAEHLRDSRPADSLLGRVPDPSDPSEKQWKRDVRAVIAAFRSDNSRFDEDRFLKALGAEDL